MLPLPVLEEIRDELLNYRGSGMCVMEMSHRSKVFQTIIDEAEADLRALMGIPENYKVLFVQGGATLQFAMIPMNLMKNGVADYIVTGSWSEKAYKEATKYGEIKLLAKARIRVTAKFLMCRTCPFQRMQIMSISVKMRLFMVQLTKNCPTQRGKSWFPINLRCSFLNHARLLIMG